jgi:hypothetical protein
MNGHRVLGIACLFIVFGAKLNADPLNYRIDFTREGGSPGSPTPGPVMFTYDSDTGHFTGGDISWGPIPTFIGPTSLGFPSLFDCIGPFAGCFPGRPSSEPPPNSWTPTEQRALLNSLLLGANHWDFYDAAPGFDDYYTITSVFGDDSFTLGGVILGVGYNSNTEASGTFTTTIVSEPPTLFLSVLGLLGLVAFKQRGKILASVRNSS